MSLGDLVPNLLVVSNTAFLIVWACLLLLVDLAIPEKRKGLTAGLAAFGLAAALVLTLLPVGQIRNAFGSMVVVDGFSMFLSVLFLLSGLVGIALAYDYLKRMDLERGEYYVLLLFSIAGMMVMATASDLIIVFLALELLSIPLYVMAGFAFPHLESEEASLKYFLLGSFSTGIIVYGIALIFGATGATGLAQIVAAVQSPATTVNSTLLTIGAAMVLIGLGFKVAIVPFHMWTPDVYQGAPSAVTAFMAVGAKAAGFTALLRIFILALPSLSQQLIPVLWGLSALTMILGNVTAIVQTNIKRMLAYSSIANAGYIMLALVPYGNASLAGEASASVLFYLLAYAFTSFAAWSVVIALEQQGGKGLNIEDYAGLGRKAPALAAAMTAAMLSFIGVPPTLGFVGKFFLFRTAIAGGFVGLAILAVFTSFVSAYYYLRVVVVMYMREGDPAIRQEPWLYGAAIICAAATALLGIFTTPLFQSATQAVLRLF